MRSFASLLLVGFLVLVSTGSQASNNVEGYLSINDNKIYLTHGYVTLEQDYFNPAQKQLRLILASKALKSTTWIDSADPNLHYFELNIGPDRFLRSLTLSDDMLTKGSISGVGIAQIEFDQFDPTEFSGQISTSGEFQTSSDTIEIHVSFHVLLDETWDIDAALAALESKTIDEIAKAPVSELDLKLAEAVDLDDTSLVAELLSKGANANFRHSSRSLLTWSADYGHTDIVRILLEHKADTKDIDWLGHHALSRALVNNHKESVELLLQADSSLARVEPQNTTLGNLAIQTLDIDMMQLMIDAGVDFDLAPIDGEVPIVSLVKSSRGNVTEIIKLLGDAGVDMNPKESYVQPLYFAVENDKLELVKALLQAGSDPNTSTNQGDYPLFASIDNAEVAAVLLEAGANPDQLSEWGEAPIMSAIGQDAIETVELLLTYGADINTKNPQGYSALDIARNGERETIVALLEQYESKSTNTTESSQAVEQLAKIEFISAFTLPGSSVAYFSNASVDSVVAFYNDILNQQGWKQTASMTDFKTYATLKYSLDANAISASIVANGSQTMISLTDHGSLKVSKILQYPSATTVYEDDSMGIYTTNDPVSVVASEIRLLLETDDWQGETLVDQADLHQLKMQRDNSILDVMITVAPAQQNQTSIQYTISKQ